MSESKCCPFCGSEYLNMMGYNFNKVCCSNVNCYIYGVAFIKEDWITRAPQNYWISVDDDLPDNDDEFLVVSHGETRTCRFNPWRSDPHKNREYSYMWFEDVDIQGFGVERCNVGGVTYWMPLPTPPKEGIIE